MPNVRALAEADLALTLEDPNGAGTPYTLIASGVEYPVVGTYDDIGFLIDPVSGEAIQARTITATCRLSTIMTLAGKAPGRGWKARVSGLHGGTHTLYVQRNEIDRTIGICRLTLGIKLEEVQGE
jgi:hypothetical protein